MGNAFSSFPYFVPHGQHSYCLCGLSRAFLFNACTSMSSVSRFIIEICGVCGQHSLRLYHLWYVSNIMSLIVTGPVSWKYVVLFFEPCEVCITPRASIYLNLAASPGNTPFPGVYVLYIIVFCMGLSKAKKIKYPF